MRSSLKDVAREAGVSVATVSRHLNGSINLPEGTRKRVDDAVSKLSYRPNPHARRLSLGKSDSIALIVPDIANPFFSSLAASIELAAAEHGSMVVLHATFDRAQREVAALEMAIDNHMDGIIFMSNGEPDPRVTEIINQAARVVVMDELVPGAQAPKLLCDNETGGFLAGRHLAEMGHRDVAYIGGSPRLASTAARLEGLRRGLASADGASANGDSAGEDSASGAAAPEVRLFTGDHSVEAGRRLAERFLDQAERESALFVGSDELTIGVIEILKERGIAIPEELSLVSFDDARSLHLYDPPITAVRQPARALGRRAVELIFEGDWEAPGFRNSAEVLPVALTKRASVAALDNTPINNLSNNEERDATQGNKGGKT